MRIVLALALLLVAAGAHAQDPGLIATSMRSHSSTMDTLLLDSITSPAAYLRDGRVFDAASEIAADDGASIEARVFAIRTLLWLRMPGVPYGFGELTQPEGCPLYFATWHVQLEYGDTPLPPGHNDQLQVLLLELHADTTESPMVRRAAGCAAAFPQHASVLADPAAPDQYLVIAGDRITIDYLCGNRFVVRNPYYGDMEVGYRVVGAEESGVLSLPARHVDGPPTETVLTTAASGTVELILDEGMVYLSVENLGQPCE